MIAAISSDTVAAAFEIDDCASAGGAIFVPGAQSLVRGNPSESIILIKGVCHAASVQTFALRTYSG